MMPVLVKHIDDKNILSARNKKFIFLFALLSVLAMLLLPSAKAQQTVPHEVIQDVPLNQAELDQILAPIALYPDSLLSQILVASTYPLEVVQAARWRQANSNLDENQVMAAIESIDWDPSVKALAPFEDLLVRISEDLQWLQSLGDAFLQNEDQVLVSVQNLRQVAYDNGSIANSDYYQVTMQDDNIIIESTHREIVYVPYYDTRVVYGNWWWDGYGPTYWQRPSNYVYLSGGFYWNSSYYVRPNFFFSAFHWGSRRLVINQIYYDNYYRYRSFNRTIGISNYTRWSHNPTHRRGVRYPQQVVRNFTSSNRVGVSNTRNTINRSVVNLNTRQTNTRQISADSVQQKLSIARQSTRSTSTVDRRQPTRVGIANTQVRTVRPTTTSRTSTINNSRTILSNTSSLRRTTPTVNRTTSTRRTAPVVTNTQDRNTSLRQTAVNTQASRTNTTRTRSTSNTRTSQVRSTSNTNSADSSTQQTTTTNQSTLQKRRRLGS